MTNATPTAVEAVNDACDEMSMERRDALRVALLRLAGTTDRYAAFLDGTMEASGDEIARALAERVAKVASGILTARLRRAMFGIAAAACVTGILLGGLTAVAAYQAGRAAGQAEALQVQATAPSIALDLMRWNDFGASRSRAREWRDPATGRLAGSLPVWLEPSAPPPPERR